MANAGEPLKRVEFLFDFGSPNAYFSHRVIPGIEARTGARFAYVPVLLGGIFKLTNNRAPMDSYGEVRHKLAYHALERDRFIARHGLTQYRFNPHFPVNTLTLMRAAVAAAQQGVLAPYVEAMFHHMWEAPKKLDEPAILHAALTDAGLDADALLHAAQQPPIKAALIAQTEAAVERGTFGIPTFFVGDDIYFGKDRLRDVEEALAAR